ncbi:MAG: ABC transporter substrate-binding protein [Dehalococcoidales bacterium]|nr:ABC transporter substrate-binding protein [Dehalococcoidales bacterium]
MKRFLILAMVPILLIGLILGGCGGDDETTAPVTTTPAPTTTVEPAKTSLEVPEGRVMLPAKPGGIEPGVKTGGTLNILAASGPTVLGGFSGGPADLGAQFPGLDSLLAPAPSRTAGIGMEPSVAEWYEDDIENKVLRFKIWEGITMHDGNELTVDDIMWGIELSIANGRWTYIDLWEGMTKIDDYTFEMHYNTYNNQIIQNWAWIFPRSQEAYELGSGGDDEAGAVWDRENLVGCGPFTITEYKRDVHLIWDKFEDYWQEGRPYLDRVFIRYIPDSVTAKAMMEAGEADYWLGAPATDQIDLFDKGFKKVVGWVGLVYSLWPNTSDPDSIWNDVRLRQALDYALEKDVITDAIGRGEYNVLWQLAPETEWGYDPNYPERRYDPDKARELMTLAGFPDGLKTTLIYQNTPVARDMATAIKQYLAEVDIEVELDEADAGRFFGTVWGVAQPGLSLMWSGMDITNFMTYQRWFSTDPFTDLVYLGHTEEQAALDVASLLEPTREGQMAATDAVYKYLNDGAYLISLMQTPSVSVSAQYVKSSVPQYQQGFVRFQYELLWMDK